MTETTATATAYDLFVVGPCSTGTSIRVHASDQCRQAKREMKTYRLSAGNGAYPERHTSVQAMVEEWYSDHFYENDGDGDWEQYLSEFHFCACAPRMPHRDGEPVAEKVQRATPKAVARAARTQVGVWPEAPAKLQWTKDGDVHTATGERFAYQIRLTVNGRYRVVQRYATGKGTWVAVGGAAATVQQAKTLAGYAAAGATWLTYKAARGYTLDTLGMPGIAKRAA